MLSAVTLIILVPNSIGTLVNIGWDVSAGLTLFLVATVLVSAYGLWLLVPGKGRMVYEDYLKPAPGD